MVVFDTNFSVLQKYLRKKISLQAMDNALFDMGMELSGEGEELKAEITPDRPDMLSTQGLARALRAYLGIQKGLPEYKIKKADYKIVVESSVKEVRPYTACAVVKNLKFDDENIKGIINIQEKLHATYGRNRKKVAIGIYPLEKIKFPITYKALKPEEIKFQPLEADREMTALQILQRHPTGREYAHLLEGKKKFPVFVDASGSIMSMPPIINSHTTGKITEKTKEVFIECSGFDFEALKKLLNMIVTMLGEMGGEIYSVELSCGSKKIITPDLTPEKRELDIEYANKVLGSHFKPKEVIQLLEKMQYSAVQKGKKISLLVPAFRTDIWHDVDVIDDIARAYGLNNFESTLKPVPTIAEALEGTDLKNIIGELMVGLGYQETFTLALTSKTDQFKQMNINEMPHIDLGVAAEKSINMVRCWLLPETIKTLVNNKDKSFPQKIFELEDIVVPNKSKDSKAENITKLCVLSSHTNANFTELKQVLDFIMSIMNKEYSIKPTTHGSFIEGRNGIISVDGKEVGIIGEINPKVLSNLNLAMPVAALEIKIDSLA